MSGDGVNDVHIPSVFMQQADVSLLRLALASHPVKVMLRGAKGPSIEEVKHNTQPENAEPKGPDSNPDPVSSTADNGSSNNAEDSHITATTPKLEVSQP